MDQASARSRVTWPVVLVALLFGVSALIMVFRGGGDEAEPTRPTSSDAKVDLASLPLSSTEATIEAAPQDPRPDRVPKGTVVHPKRVVALYDEPGGTPFARIGPKQFGDTWLPVITRNRDWVQVMLPSRPNGSTGWIRSSTLREAHSRFLIRVHLGQRTMEVLEDNELVGSWPVAIGAEGTPTPTGRTFVLGQIIDDKQPFSPVILPLGSHSDTLDSYGGGPGTVAIHGWTDPSVFGKAVSHGCVRVPDEALDVVRTVPLGTPVMVDEV
ncbi:L,D-transpeptidase [Nocardioides sp. SYSU DS0651]|uniref:L,D-transpeptidase n=1 Tax=Nocardioides sp. SYSU DS0651 TaxID=3415955 RepID=UPI003F4C8E74